MQPLILQSASIADGWSMEATNAYNKILSIIINQSDRSNTDSDQSVLNKNSNFPVLPVANIIEVANKKGRFSMKQPFQDILLL